mmetsp:Transcript_23010/g.41438  ORF Transcript_23010/g.41438 Transcript_23010/m.41438 type:complete len:126 (+) Transcript_23010:1050-1427(+)
MPCWPASGADLFFGFQTKDCNLESPSPLEARVVDIRGVSPLLLGHWLQSSLQGSAESGKANEGAASATRQAGAADLGAGLLCTQKTSFFLSREPPVFFAFLGTHLGQNQSPSGTVSSGVGRQPMW